MSNQKIKLSRNQQYLLDILGSELVIINKGKKEEYSFIPFWFKKIKPDLFEIMSLENLPEELINKNKKPTSPDRI